MHQRQLAGILVFQTIFAIAPSLFADSGLIATIAGGGSGDVGGLATNMALSQPISVALDAAGNLFIGDRGRNRIVRVDAASGIATLVAGNGQASYSGDGGPATLAGIGYPGFMVVDATGDLIFSDTVSNRVRRVDALSGVITTVAGTGAQTSSGDGGPASAASVNTPYGLALDRNGNLFIADSYRVRRVDAASGIISTFAGTGSVGSTPNGYPATATSISPFDLAFDAAGNLYIADGQSLSIRRVDAATGLVSTVAGTGPASPNPNYTGDGAPATSSGIAYPGALQIDSAGNIFFVLTAYNRILKVDAVSHLICTVAGNGVTASTGDQGPATSASLNVPYALALAPNGNIIATEMFGNRVRRINLPSPLTYTATALSSSTSGQTVTLTAAVNSIGVSGTPTGSVFFFDSNTFIGSTQINSGTAIFSTSTLAAGPHNLTASYAGDGTFNSSTSLPISVTVTPATPVPTSITIASTNNPSLLNASVTFVVTLSPGTDNNGHSPTGTVELRDSTAGMAVWTNPVAGGQQISMTFTAPGNHSMSAYYYGDSYFAASNSSVIIQTVKGTPTVNFASDTNPSLVGGTIIFTTLVAPSTATGTITFTDQASVPGTPVTLATVPLVNSVATFPTSSLAAGTHYITANYNGDANYLSASSSYITQVVNKLGSTAAISTTQNPAFPNQNIVVSYQVAPSTSTALVPTGTVQLLDGATVLSSATLSGGSGQFQVSFPAAGSHSLTAVYSGDGNFGGSTSAVLNESVKNLATATISVDVNPATAGATVTFTGTVLQSGATGTMTFQEYPTPGSNPVPLGTVAISNGKAIFPISTLAAGPHYISVAYNGDANFLSSGGSYITETIRVATTTTVSATSNSLPVGQAVVFTAQVSPATATGTVQFMDGATSLGTGTLNNGAASLSVATLSAGTHSITAVYGGDTGNAGSTSAVWTQTITKIVTTISLTSSANPAAYGQPVTLTATVSPAAATGSVQFIDGATSLGVATLMSGAASLSTSTLAAGSHSLTAIYSGDVSNAGSTSTALTQTISPATTTVSIVSSANPATYGQPVTLTATVSPATATGTVQFLDGSTTLGAATLSSGTAALSIAALSPGAHAITAVYSGDANNAGSTSTALSQTVNKITTTTTVASSANPATYGQTVTLTATVSPAAATGTVQFLDGAASLGTGTVSNGRASFSTTALTTGNHSLTAVYSGDANDNGSSSTALSQVISASATTTTLQASTTTPTYGQSVQLTATVTPATATGTIQFLDGGSLLATVTVSSGSASTTVSNFGAGAHSLTAFYGGDANDASGGSSAVNVTVSQANSTTALGSSVNPSAAGQSVTFTATVSPSAATGTVQLLDGSTVLGTVTLNAGSAALSISTLSAGSHSITASYSGNGNYKASSGSLSQTVTSPAPGAPSNLTATAASSSQINLQWTASATSGVTYNIYSSMTSGFTPSASNKIASGITATSYSNTGLSPSSTHYYVVKAQNSGGESAGTNQASATTQAAGGSCHVVYGITTQWNVGFGTAITIQNTGTQPINGWRLSWTWAGNQQITQAWNSNYTQTGNAAALTNAAWNPTIAPGATISGMGFNGSYSGANPPPAAFYLNGSLCN